METPAFSSANHQLFYFLVRSHGNMTPAAPSKNHTDQLRPFENFVPFCLRPDPDAALEVKEVLPTGGDILLVRFTGQTLIVSYILILPIILFVSYSCFWLLEYLKSRSYCGTTVTLWTYSHVLILVKSDIHSFC